jgi:hypothetical protein
MNKTIQIPYLSNPIWSALKDFSVGSQNAQLTFVKRLAGENRWSQSHAQRVFEEYKKFVFLAVSADHAVTPSDEVDQAWHLHLVYTQSYWTELCEEVLKRPLHHGPTKGGIQEGEKFYEQYSKTIESYERIFGHKPPADIWPSPVKRFKQAEKFARVNTGDYWLIEKPGPVFSRATAFSASALAGLLFAACSAKSDAGNIFTILFVVGMFLVVFIIAYRNQKGDGGCGTGCGTGGWSGNDGSGDGGGCGSSGCGGSGCGS